MRALGVLTLICSGLAPSVLSERITVDDAHSLWTYTGSWVNITPSNPCPTCWMQPDPQRALNYTWHDTFERASASLSFTGVSIEIHVINPPNFNLTFRNNWSFVLDSVDDGYFVAPRRDGVGQYVYHYVAYARTNLPLSNHTISIVNNPAGYLLLDYAVYDNGIEAAVPSPACAPCRDRSYKRAAIGCGTVAGLAILTLVIIVISRKSDNPSSRTNGIN